jgi:hypothetical protein
MLESLPYSNLNFVSFETKEGEGAKIVLLCLHFQVVKYYSDEFHVSKDQNAK